MSWECHECGSWIDQDTAPYVCAECGIAGEGFARAEPDDDDPRAVWTWAAVVRPDLLWSGTSP